MYTRNILRRRDAVGRRALNGVGLGDSSVPELITSLPVVNQIPIVSTMFGSKEQKGYGTVSKVGQKSQEVIGILDMVLPMFGFKFIGKLIDKIGIFKKATHMESCMNWWSDSNIRGMASGLAPYPFVFEEYMMKEFPQFLRQYQIKQADGTWASVGVESLLNTSNRQSRIATIFTRIVRENPDIMKLQCASMPQGRAETGYVGEGAEKYFEQIKEVARQEEYSTIATQVDKLVAPWKVKETWGAIVKSRNEQLAVRTDQGSQMKIADNVIGVKRGAFVMTLKTPQGKEQRVSVPPKALSGSVPVQTMSW